MSDQKDNNDLIKLAQEAADGELKKTNSNNQTEQKLLDSLQLINKVRNSFKTSDAIYQEDEEVAEGEQWGSLRIIKKIGEGGVGLVYLAHDSVLDRQVAVKFLNPKSAEYISSKSFIAEARRMAKVRHPNVLAVFGANTYKNTTGFWCDYLIGETLDKKINSELSAQHIISIADNLANALQEVHKNQIIHGDIKPSNVMIDKYKNAILMDFGSGIDLQQNLELLTSSTPLIMAPELFSGNAKTKSSDIYALGVLFYYLSTKGQFPHQARSIDELKTIVNSNTAINFSKINGTKLWKNLVVKMLQIDANKRPDINEVKKQISKIILAPIVRNKKIAFYSVMAFLLSTTIILAYSFISLKSEQSKTQMALNETSEVNQLMFNMLSSASPGMKGKDVLMVDVLNELIEETKNSPDISNNNKVKTLFTLAHSLRNLGYLNKSSALLDEISGYSDLNDIIKVQILYAQAEFEIKKQYNKTSIQKAQVYLDEAKTIFNSMAKKDFEIYAKLQYSQALIYDKANQKDAAIIESKKALDFWILQQPTKSANRQKGLIYLLLGNLHSAKSLYQESIEYYRLAEQNFESYDQNINSNLLGLKNNLAEIYSQTGQTELALSMYKELIDIGNDFLGESHSDILIYKLNYASALNDNKKPQESLDLIDAVLPDIIKKFGDKSMASVVIQSTKASALKNLKKYKEAENIYKKLIEIAVKQFGENHPQVLLTEYNLAELYYESGVPELSHKLLSQRLPIAIEELGEKNTITLEMQQALAWSENLLGNKETAKRQMLEVIALKKEVFGAQNDVTQTAIDMMQEIENN